MSGEKQHFIGGIKFLINSNTIYIYNNTN